MPASEPTPELIADYACQTGEGPMWHPTEKKVYWCDIPNGRLFRYDPKTGQHEKCFEHGVVGGYTIQADGALLLFMAKGAIRLWKNGQLTTLRESLAGEEDSRFNDVIADPLGGVFCGTMTSKTSPGRLYRLDTDGKITNLLENIGCSNGMGFTLDRKQMYYTDTGARKIYLFDYDGKSGAITNQKVWLDTTEESNAGGGYPDGMTVDAEGFIWSARWDGSCLVRYNRDGKEVQRIGFPAKKVSSVVFGGEDYSDMYVTTAGGNKKDTDGKLAGALFRLRVPGVKGLPEFVSRVKVP